MKDVDQTVGIEGMLAAPRAGRGGAFLRFPVATMGTGGWCKCCKSKLDWCDQRGVSSLMRLKERGGGGGGGGKREAAWLQPESHGS